MLGRGVRIWLAVLGLLGGLLVAPAHADGCCPPQSPDAAEFEIAGAHADSCCSSADREPAQPAEDERGGCKCPRSCCAAPAPAATIRLSGPIAWRQAPVGTVPLAVVSARSADYHLDLMRPPRS